MPIFIQHQILFVLKNLSNILNLFSRNTPWDFALLSPKFYVQSMILHSFHFPTKCRRTLLHVGVCTGRGRAINSLVHI